jgi:hypothetical protein
MGLFKKKQRPAITEIKCPAEGCPYTFNDPALLKRHIEWKHPELVQEVEKSNGARR